MRQSIWGLACHKSSMNISCYYDYDSCFLILGSERINLQSKPEDRDDTLHPALLPSKPRNPLYNHFLSSTAALFSLHSLCTLFSSAQRCSGNQEDDFHSCGKVSPLQIPAPYTHPSHCILPTGLCLCSSLPMGCLLSFFIQPTSTRLLN